jgi:outer membrane protein
MVSLLKRTMQASHVLLLAAGLMMGADSATATGRSLDLPPPLELNLAPDVCEMPPTLMGLSLRDAVQVALCRTPDVHQATIAIEENVANLDAARAKYLPTLNADADASRIGKHVKYPAHPVRNYDLYAYSGNARLGLNWLLFDSGQRRAQYDNAHAKLSAALYNKVLVNRDRTITVADSYYKARSATASATAAREAAARAEKNFHATQRLREGGVGSIADELLAKVAWQRHLVDSETKATAAEITKIALITAIGLPSQTHLSLAATNNAATAIAAEAPAVTRSTVNEHITSAIRNHPRLAAARANTLASEAETQAIAAQHLPKISLQADRHLGITPPANAVARENVNSWSVGLTVHIPIFDGLATRYATDAARARSRAARETERAVWLEEELKLLTDFNHMTSAAQKAALLKDAETSAEQAYRSAQIRYRQGVGTAVELLKAQDEFAGVQQAAIDVHYELLAAQFRVAVALDTLPPIHIDSP